jgi:hypothetical protein
MSSMLTNRGMHSILSGTVDLTADTIKVMLLDSTFTPLATHNFVSEISSDELTGSGYVAGFAGSGRKTLASKTFTEDDTDGVVTFDAADLTWAAINAGTAKYAAIIKEITNDAASLVIGYVEFTPRVTNGSSLVVSWSTAGIFRITGWGGDSSAEVRVVTYTASGGEGTDFNVTIGSTMAADDYEVFWSPAGITNLPILDLPIADAGDRTTTTFRVTTADSLTAGDVLKFLLVE